MKVNSLRLVCFSPTGTTRSIIQAIADGTGYDQGDLVDLTSPRARRPGLRTSPSELLVVAVPVYVGRVPGTYPYRKLEDPLSVDFIDIGDGCLQCGVCAESCPVGAIALEDSSLRDKEKCVLCCACIKRCPEAARTMRAGTVKDIAARVSLGCQERRDPVFFF